jgi:methionyl-tRNA formyltransferase
MRVVFCGSGVFAVPSLRAVGSSAHELAGVVTQPARRAGRGGKMRPTPVDEAARAAGMDVLECPNINAPSAVEWIQDKRPDVLCVADFGQMVRSAAREAARVDAFNLHGSLLPELRGAAPVNWAIIRGHTRTGVTTFSLVDKLDAGATYLQAATDISPDETAEELRQRLAEIGAEVVCRTIDLLAEGNAKPTAQDESAVTLAPQLTKGDGIIDWAAPAEVVRNLIHGTWPWPGAQAVYHRQDGYRTQVAIARAAVEDGTADVPGKIDADLCVGTGECRLRIRQIRPAGKRLMEWRDFVNGFRPQPGDCFQQPEG